MCRSEFQFSNITKFKTNYRNIGYYIELVITGRIFGESYDGSHPSVLITSITYSRNTKKIGSNDDCIMESTVSDIESGKPII